MYLKDLSFFIEMYVLLWDRLKVTNFVLFNFIKKKREKNTKIKRSLHQTYKLNYNLCVNWNTKWEHNKQSL